MISQVQVPWYTSIKKAPKTQLIADASPVGLGAVLTQQQDGEVQVISYASRTLSSVECRYSQTEKEALSPIWACERFNVYLYETDFEIVTDYKLLEVIYSPKSNPPDTEMGPEAAALQVQGCLPEWQQEHSRLIISSNIRPTANGRERSRQIYPVYCTSIRA